MLATVGDHAQASSHPPPMCQTSLMSSQGHSFSSPSGQNSSFRPRSFLCSACIRHLLPGREWSLRSADFPFAPEPRHPLREPASVHHTSASHRISKTAPARAQNAVFKRCGAVGSWYETFYPQCSFFAVACRVSPQNKCGNRFH